VLDGYLRDLDFDRWYPLSAVMPLMTTSPPTSLESLTVPAMLVVASQCPAYIVDLYHRFPPSRKLAEIDGSVSWMISYPQRAATLIGDRFSCPLCLTATPTANRVAKPRPRPWPLHPPRCTGR
jgi:hypothetical protein